MLLLQAFFTLSRQVPAPFAAGCCGLVLALVSTPVLTPLCRTASIRIDPVAAP